MLYIEIEDYYCHPCWKMKNIIEVVGEGGEANHTTLREKKKKKMKKKKNNTLW